MQILDTEYKEWFFELKSKIRSSQIKAAVAVNAALINFYWGLGKMIAEKQETAAWGNKLIEQLSLDLKEEFPTMTGFSSRNLKYCRSFYNFYKDTIVQQAVAQLQNISIVKSQQAVNQLELQLLTQIPWGHHIYIFTKSENVVQAQFYIQQTIENAWSRDTLALQIKSQLFARQGKSITNFKNTLPEPLSDLAQQTLKDPYIFDFVTMSSKMKERDLEKQLVAQISKFLLELGKGFAFVGQQYALEIADKEYFLDLLFYHIKLKCYVVVELKNTAFMPEYTGKMNFYLSTVDTLLKQDDDRPTIGILLCRDKNNIETEFALRDINKPIGISEFSFCEILPEELKSSLPTIEEIENELQNRIDTTNE
ncbi:putative nuclease of restriction endonuclease-like (RecB) superfamily [Flavobacterium sp. PL11]|uniref:PDDEXK nuclease domain-containing protein n=1 Tax=Flavobacterium sp. PL11 TaxID=3071717 RepID=UPI002E048F22|nr:putative nuclease of restriction endonuclease-like (RecB) superfamily [Flavobacterium sp. PL11]